MFDPRIGTFLRSAARLLGRPEPTTTDAVLLERLSRHRDAAAFTELVARHGPAIWSLCQRLIRSEPDAEDVFQATFLVLTRDAARVRKAASVGSWLYGVAVRLGRKVRARGGRLPDPARLRPRTEPSDPAMSLSWSEVRVALDEELGHLPDVLRAPILLCYFNGMTQDEAAKELGWTQRAVKARVARGRDLLRKRLIQRGIELPAALSVPLLSVGVASAIPPRVQSNLLGIVQNILQKQPLAQATSPAVIALVQTELPAMSFLRIGVLIVLAMGLVTAGSLGWLSGRSDSTNTAKHAPENEDSAPTVNGSDPTLPPGARRIGTTLFRPGGWSGTKAFYTRNGKTLVVPLMEYVVEFWNAESGQRLNEMSFPNSHFQDADFTPSSNLLAMFGWFTPEGEGGKSELAVWLVDAETHKVIRTIRHPGDLEHTVNRTVRFTPDGKRLITGLDNDIRVWDVKTGTEVIHQAIHQALGTAIANLIVSPDGKIIAYRSAFGQTDLFLWKWEAGEEPKRFATIGALDKITFGPDGKTLCTISGDGRLRLFELSTGRATRTVDIGYRPSPNSSFMPSHFFFSPDGKTLAVAYQNAKLTKENNSIILWNIATGEEQARLPISFGPIHINWSPDGSRLAATSGYRMWTWDVKTGKPLCPDSPGHDAPVQSSAFGPDGRLFTASIDYTIRSWDLANGKPGLELVHDTGVNAVAVSPDGSLVAGSGYSGLRIWDTKTGRELFQLPGDRIRKVQFSADGKQLIGWSDLSYLRIWDIRNGKLVVEHSLSPDGKLDAGVPGRMVMRELSSLSGDGSTLALCRSPGVQLFDVQTGKVKVKLEVNTDGLSELTLSPDGTRLSLAYRGKPVEKVQPDGTRQFSQAEEHKVEVWDLTAEKLLWQTKTAGIFPVQVGFSADGSLLIESTFVMIGKKDIVQVWEATTGKDLGRIELPYRGHLFSLDRSGKKLAVANYDTTLVVYDLETALKLNNRK